MKKEPENKYKKIYWVVCLIAVVVILAARLILHFAGVELSDTLSDVFNWAEAVAVAAMAFFYLRWRQGVRGK